MYMVRKQLYITEAQEEALKQRAHETGLSEAELVRRALEAELASEYSRRWRPDRAEAVAALKETWRGATGRLGDPFDRDATYEDRTDQLYRDPER